MNRTATRTIRRTLSALAAAGLAITACGGDDDAGADASDPPADTTASESTDAEPAPTDAPATTEAPAATEPPATTEAPAATEPPATTEAPAATDTQSSEPLVSLADTDLGQVLVAADGLTLYMFVPDEGGDPTCTGACAGTWPPYFVDEGVELTAGEGLDPALLSLVAHPDGGEMLAYGELPLYYYAGDAAPGDVNGQGVNDVWWVVDGDGAPIQ